ncbi:MAG: hypothetical protein ACFE78_06250 [Candidatus Hodarchaeota archaeon]
MDLIEADEYLHPPTKEIKWRESYYFNWVDLKNKISGFSTVGIVPNENRREMVFFLFLEDKKEIYYKQPLLESYEENIELMLQDKRLSYSLIKPFKLWHISYNSRKLKFDISFKTRFPTYYFGLDSSASWQQHFEASGIIEGNLKLHGEVNIKVKGFGQRDKSWGYRDWHQFDKWYAGHFQFKEWSCAFRKDHIEDRVDLSGHISNNKGNLPLKSLDINTTNENDKFESPLISIYKIEDINGNIHQIKAERISKDSFIRFTRSYSQGYTELFEQMVIMTNMNTGEIGSGMMEHLRTKRIKRVL